MKSLLGYFFKGLLFTVPIAVTIYVVVWIFTTIDGLLNIPIPGVGFILTIILITVIGILTSNIFTQKILNFVDNLLKRLPVVKLIYNSLKDLMGAFVGDKKSFDKPVLVEVSASGIKVGGFMTQSALNELGLKEFVAVYLPQSYNFAGNVVFVPSNAVTPLDIDSSAMMAFIVSGGVTGKKSE